MRIKGKYLLLIIVGAVLLFLALNPLKMNSRYIFFAAAPLIILTAVKQNWINGVFMALLFTFAYYSMHSAAGLAGLALNLAVLSAFAVLADRLKAVKKEEKASTVNREERVFVNKVVNSFMIAHEMLWEIKKGMTHGGLLELFAKNIFNVIEVKQAMIYTGKDGDPEGVYRLVFSYGPYVKDKIAGMLAESDIKGKESKNISVEKAEIIKTASKGFYIIIPLVNEKGVKDIAVAYKESEFDYSDIYIAEFFAAQVFVIIEKQKLLNELKGNYEKIIGALSLAIDTKDHETHGHSLETMNYAIKIAEKLKLSDEEKEKIKYASLLHDIGKINVSSAILNKPSSLTEEEYEKVKKHPADGANILNKLNIFSEILPIILYHHEHFNGKGYPFQLKGKDIPLGSRICAIADAYSVMRSDRPYRKAMTKEDAVAELKRCAGSQFDSELVDVFLEIIEEDKEEKEEKGGYNNLISGMMN